jgi:hypothetical protein
MVRSGMPIDDWDRTTAWRRRAVLAHLGVELVDGAGSGTTSIAA